MRRYVKASLGLLADQWCKYSYNPKHYVHQLYQAPYSFRTRIVNESSSPHMLLLRDFDPVNSQGIRAFG